MSVYLRYLWPKNWINLEFTDCYLGESKNTSDIVKRYFFCVLGNDDDDDYASRYMYRCYVRYSSLFCVLRGKLVNSVRNHSTRRCRGYAVITVNFTNHIAEVDGPIQKFKVCDRCVLCKQKVQLNQTPEQIRYRRLDNTQSEVILPSSQWRISCANWNCVYTKLQQQDHTQFNAGRLASLVWLLSKLPGVRVLRRQANTKKLNPKISNQNLQYQGRSFCFIIHFVVVILLLSAACRLIYCCTTKMNAIERNLSWDFC